MRHWPIVLAVTVVAGLTVASVVASDFTVVGGAWAVLWISVLVVGAIIVSRVPDNRIGLFMFAYGILSGLTGSMIGLAAEFSPDSVPWYEPVGWALNTSGLMLISVMLLRFPTGALLSQRWRVFDVFAVVVAAGGAVAAAIANGWGGDPEQARIVGPLYDDYRTIAEVGTRINEMGMIVLVAGLVSLVLRYRRGDGVQRVQLRWLLFAVAIVVVALPFLDTVASNSYQSTDPWTWVMSSVIALIPVSIGIAIVRHGLFDIDRLISRTLIYASVLAVIASVYVAIVFGVGSLIGETAPDSPLLSIVATAIVAVIFQPARERFEKIANHIVFGRRATPYEVLSQFTRRVAATDEALLAGIAQSIVDGTIASAATLWSDDDAVRPISSWPEDQPSSSAATHDFPIDHDGTRIGRLTVTIPVGETLPPADLALIGELTNGIALALWNRTLTTNLRQTVEDLKSSRRRLVAIQDETRHALERDLHDGAQQRLVALKVRLSIASQVADKLGADSTVTVLRRICDHTDTAIETLREFARGVYPPLLRAEGLGAALTAHVGRVPQAVTVRDLTTRRHPETVEATTYFTILQTLTTIDPESPTTITIADTDSHFHVTIESTLPYPPPTHLADRYHALDGTITHTDNTTTASLPTTVGIAETSARAEAVMA